MSYKLIDCPLCGSKKFNVLFSKKSEDFVRCDECDLVYINPQPTFDEVLIDTYDGNYANLYIKKAKSKYRRSFNRIKRLIKIHQNAKTSLDIGCSAGFVVKAASDLGLDAYGVEVEKTGPQYAKEVLGLENIFNMMLHEAHFEDSKFDIVSIYEVLEHIPDLNAFLRELSRIMNSNGIVHVSVPNNAGHWLRKNSVKKLEAAALPSEHLYEFSPKTLSKLLEKHGFEIIKVHVPLFKPQLQIIAKKG